MTRKRIDIIEKINEFAGSLFDFEDENDSLEDIMDNIKFGLKELEKDIRKDA